MEKKKILAVIAIVAIAVATVVIIVMNNSAPQKISVEKEGRKNIENFTKLLINGGTEKQLKEATGIKMFQPLNIMVGADSYIRKTPKNQSEIAEYINQNKEYANNLENKIKDNFEYKLTKEAGNKEGVTFKITYKSYYYSAYLMDTQELQKQLLTYVDTKNLTDETKDFKLKVKAMEILDSKLDVYNNKNENIIAFKYKSLDSEETQNSFYSYMLSLEQYTYNDKKITTLHNDRTKRISQYIQEAINNGIIK